MPETKVIEPSALKSEESRFPDWAVFVLAGLVWLPAFARYSIEWTINPQYYYGWAVPVLTAYLLSERYIGRPPRIPPLTRWPAILLIIVLALPQLPLRLLAEPNTDWRMISWAMAAVAGGITFALFYLFGGWKWMFYFSFPIVFLGTSIPWPGGFESMLVQGMMRINAQVASEFVSFCGVPAIAMGNIIQLPNGVLGVNEACSGIRSLQSTFMASLFLGELYRLRVGPRIFLFVTGIVIAFLFNVVRTSFLTWQGAFNGIEATDRWHDAAGFTILGAVLICLFLVSMVLERLEIAAKKYEAMEKTELLDEESAEDNESLVK